MRTLFFFLLFLNYKTDFFLRRFWKIGQNDTDFEKHKPFNQKRTTMSQAKQNLESKLAIALDQTSNELHPITDFRDFLQQAPLSVPDIQTPLTIPYIQNHQSELRKVRFVVLFLSHFLSESLNTRLMFRHLSLGCNRTKTTCKISRQSIKNSKRKRRTRFGVPLSWLCFLLQGALFSLLLS